MSYIKTKGSSPGPVKAPPASESGRARLLSAGETGSFSAFHSKYGLKFPEPFLGKSGAPTAGQAGATHDSDSVVGFIESIAGRIDDLLAAAAQIEEPAA